MALADLELYSTALSPFALRIQLVLAEKGLTAKHIEGTERRDSISELPEPYRQTPLLLKHGSEWVAEAAIIAEYLDEHWPKPKLLPSDPPQRARGRMWINFADSRLYPTTAQLLRSTDSRVHSMALAQIESDLLTIEHRALDDGPPSGAYWFGDQFSLVDATYYPWFEQLVVLEHFRGFRWPQGCDRLWRWWESVAARPSAKSIAGAPDRHLEHYAAVLKVPRAR
jgi:glutathione S-transferase